MAERVFPDFSLDELKRRSEHFSCENAYYQLSSVDPTPVPDEHNLTTVPEDIMDRIPVMIRICLQCTNRPLRIHRNIDFIDFCAGKARLSRWGEFYGLVCVPFDNKYSPKMNAAKLEGLAILYVLVLRVKPGGLVGGGPQCSTWVWLSRPHTKRSETNLGGDTGSKPTGTSPCNRKFTLYSHC